MRILLVTDWPDHGGGIETYLMQVAGGLREAGDEVRLLTSSVGGGSRVADYVAPGSRHPVRQAVWQVANRAAAATVRRAVAEFRPDVVHVNMFEMHLSPAIFDALRSVPVVLSIAYYKPVCPNGLKLLPDDRLCGAQPGMVCWRSGCTSLPHWLRDRVRYARIGRAVGQSATVVTCSEWMQRVLLAHEIAADWHPWPITMPDATFRRTPAPHPCFVFTGRLSREKGLETLLDAFAVVHRERPDCRLRIVGDGPLRPGLVAQAARHGLVEAVEFTGWLPVESVEAQLADAWALVAPSRWAEPLGLTALEAAVRGIPVIASATGGLAETVTDGESGWLFANGDAAALAGCMRRVADGAGADAVPPEVVARLRRRHALDAHVAWLRGVFDRVVR